MCFCVLICKSRRLGECARTRADFLPSSTGSLSADCSSRTTIQFLNISIMVFLFTSPKRSLVSSDLPPVCIRKERLYYPAHSWYLISLQALGANPTTPVLLVSPLGACICACVCVQTGTSASDNPKLVTFSALYTKGMGLWPIASDIAELPTSAPTLSSETMYCISTLNTSLLFNYYLTTGGRSPKEFGHSLKPNLATGRDEKKKSKSGFFLCLLPADSWNISKSSSHAWTLSGYENCISKLAEIKLLKFNASMVLEMPVDTNMAVSSQAL